MRHCHDTSHHQLLRDIGFVHKRGLTQGDVKSPRGWICVFDILLTAVNQCNHAQYPKAPIEDIHACTLTPLAFLDDLTSFTTTRLHTQQLADLDSAFNAIFGTKFAQDKFRALTTRTDNPTPVIAHDWQWTALSVPLGPASDIVRTLGIHLALDYTWFGASTARILGVGQLLRKRKANSLTKASVVISSTMAALKYCASLSAWPSQVLYTIGKAVSRTLCIALRYSAQFSWKLLYATTGGLGLPCFLASALKAWWRTLQRCMHGSWPAAGACRVS